MPPIYVMTNQLRKRLKQTLGPIEHHASKLQGVIKWCPYYPRNVLVVHETMET